MPKSNVSAFNLPNALTSLRILSIPFFASMLIYRQHRWALVVFVLASISDALDGLIARLTKKQTRLGQFLDPTADKFLLITSFILFSYYGWVPTWLTIGIITRDVIVVVGWGLFYLVHHVAFVKPSFMGKFAIAFQMVLVAYVLLKINFPEILPEPTLIVWVTASATIASGLHYIYRGFKYTSE
ncbi:MAG: CDP-alcohol phosphatidyltransferase family protein [Nitrospirae bacterium]|nr:CDP-alcohol phosphatidyltransferase family protein [Nitrospirota bacterium]